MSCHDACQLFLLDNSDTGIAKRKKCQSMELVRRSLLKPTFVFVLAGLLDLFVAFCYARVWNWLGKAPWSQLLFCFGRFACFVGCFLSLEPSGCWGRLLAVVHPHLRHRPPADPSSGLAPAVHIHTISHAFPVCANYLQQEDHPNWPSPGSSWWGRRREPASPAPGIPPAWRSWASSWPTQKTQRGHTARSSASRTWLWAAAEQPVQSQCRRCHRWLSGSSPGRPLNHRSPEKWS